MLERFLTNRLFQILFLLGFLGVAVAFSFSHARWREQIRNFTFDNYNILKPREFSNDIIVVDIDEASLARTGQMPWPRTVMAQLVNNLKEMGASVIAFDIVFAESDRSSPWSVAEEFKDKPGFEDLAPRFRNLPDNDALFGLAIGEAGNVITGFSFTSETTDMTPVQKGIFRGKGIEKFVPHLTGATTNLPTISRFAAGNGSFFVYTDTDGIIRRVPMLVGHDRPNSDIITLYPSLSLEIIRVLDQERGGKVILNNAEYAKLDPDRFGIKGIEIGNGKRFVPTNARGEFPVYFAKSDASWYVPAWKILDKSLSQEKIKGKIVLIGTTAVGLKDIRSSPLDPFIAGVEVHLNIIDQILHGQYLSRSIGAEGFEALAILLIGFVLIICSSLIGAGLQAMVVGSVIAGLLYGGWFAFEKYGFLVDVTYPSLSVLAIFTLSTMFTYLRAERERRAVRQAFGLYISPDFMKELTDDPSKLRLGGEIRDLTVMFTDIRNFTSISEGLSPEELIQLMNDFLTPMSDLVMQNRGTIDKYMGDAMMAFWNAPLDDADHARNACIAALNMQAALTPINEQVKMRAHARGKPPVLLNAGIGINTGPAAVGNMGSKQRFAYSTLGDAVNLASRLESQTKTYGVNILIGETTQSHIQDFATLELDLIRVKGKEKAVHIYTLLGDGEIAKKEKFQAWKSCHDLMISSYRAADFRATKDMIKNCESLAWISLDKTYDLYKARCDSLIENPPADKWDGVFDSLTK